MVIDTVRATDLTSTSPLPGRPRNLCAYTTTGAAAMVSAEAVAFFSAHVALGATFGGDGSAVDG